MTLEMPVKGSADSDLLLKTQGKKRCVIEFLRTEIGKPNVLFTLNTETFILERVTSPSQLVSKVQNAEGKDFNVFA